MGMKHPPRHVERRRGLTSRSAPLADASRGSRHLCLAFEGRLVVAKRGPARGGGGVAAGGEPRNEATARERVISVSAGGAGWSAVGGWERANGTAAASTALATQLARGSAADQPSGCRELICKH